MLQRYSFSLIVTFNDHFSWSELNQILTQHDIIRCHSDEADYQLDWQNHSDYYQYHQPTKNSYQIQHHIRTTFKHIPQLSDLRPIMPADLKRSPTQVNQLTVTICPPKLTDIINAVQRGLYFPEKSTCFSHKTSAKVLEYLTQ